MSKKQIDEISNLLLEYSAGNYGFQGKISDSVDELDMIISGINMLGEELESTNVSRDYFSSIFNAVTDLVMIIHENGLITDINKAAEEALGVEASVLGNIQLDDYLLKEKIVSKVKTSLDSGLIAVTLERKLKGAEGNVIHGQFTCSTILDRFGKFQGYLISIKDITEQKENEKVILKTIFTTQQSEQKRVADDLHDSLGQELSMTKLMISNLKNLTESNPKSLELISTCTEILDSSIKHLREICFNLMPSVLTRGGLNMAISDMVRKLEVHDQLQVSFEKNATIDRMDADLEIVMYRIAQEFINNMIKHAEATTLIIELNLEEKENKVSLLLKDNGKGFEMQRLDRIGENRGYQNLQSKVKAFNGELLMESAIGKGTSTFVKFPILPYHEED